MTNPNFIRELLSLSQKFNEDSSDEQKQSNEFQSNILNGFVENLPPEFKDKIASSKMNSFNSKELIQMFDKMPKEHQDAFSEFFERLLDSISNESPMHHKGYAFDPADIYNKYHKLKAKFTKYQESQDINNF